MSIGQIVVIVILFVGIAGFLCLKYLPNKLARAIIASLLFWFLASFLTFSINTSSSYIFNHTLSNSVLHILIGVFAIAFIIFAFLVTYLVEGEHARKIFFITSLVIFVACMLMVLVNAVFGIVNSHWTRMPGHICHQVAYLLPVIYFMKDNKARKYMLTALCIIAFVGGIITLVTPRNILYGNPFTLYTEMESVVIHLIMPFVAAGILSIGESRPNLYDLPFGAFVMFVGLVIAQVYNFLVFLQIDRWGWWASLNDELPAWLPFWVFYILCIIVGWAILLAIIYSRKALEQRKERV